LLRAVAAAAGACGEKAGESAVPAAAAVAPGPHAEPGDGGAELAQSTLVVGVGGGDDAAGVAAAGTAGAPDVGLLHCVVGHQETVCHDSSGKCQQPGSVP